MNTYISGRLVVGDLSGAVIAYHSSTVNTTTDAEPQELDQDEFKDVRTKTAPHTIPYHTYIHTYIHTYVVYLTNTYTRNF